jgi:hypothetical protein
MKKCAQDSFRGIGGVLLFCCPVFGYPNLLFTAHSKFLRMEK